MPADVEGKYGEPFVMLGPNTGGIYDREGDIVLETCGVGTASHARRAVATVNACEGFENPAVLRKIVEHAELLILEGRCMQPGGAMDQLLARLDEPAEDKEEVSA